MDQATLLRLQGSRRAQGPKKGHIDAPAKDDRETHEEFGIEHLFLVSRGHSLPVASFLGPREQAGFAAGHGAAFYITLQLAGE